MRTVDGVVVIASRSTARGRGPRGVRTGRSMTEVPSGRGLLPCRPDGSSAQGEGMTRVLVAYATKMGSTRGIAEAIGEELQKRGLRVDVENVVEVSTLNAYDAVVLGSAVYAA